MHEGIPILNYHVPKAFVHEDGKLQRHDASRSCAARIRRRRAGARWCPPASRTPSSNATRCWWRWARRTPSPGSSATAASPSTSGACRSSTRTPSSPRVPERVLRRRCGLRPEEHHHRRGARPRGGGVDRPPAARRGRRVAAGADDQPDVAEDGHPRVELRQRHLATTCATRCPGPRPRRRWPASGSRSNWASTPPRPSRRPSAA